MFKKSKEQSKLPFIKELSTCSEAVNNKSNKPQQIITAQFKPVKSRNKPLIQLTNRNPFTPKHPRLHIKHRVTTKGKSPRV